MEEVEAGALEEVDAERSALRAEAVAAAGGPGLWRDWGDLFGEGLPSEVLAKVAVAYIAQTEKAWAEWLRARYPSWSEKQIQRAMRQRFVDGHSLFPFAMVCKGWRKAQVKVGGQMRSRIWSDVIAPGRTEMAKWGLAEGCPREGGGVTMVSPAARYGHLKLVQWLCREHDFAVDNEVLKEAAFSGNLELVQWLSGKGCELGPEVMARAAQSGNLQLVKWLRAEGCAWDEYACAWAAWAGHLASLQWLRTSGCPWTTVTCRYAAERNKVHVLRWAREHGCPWTAATRDRAAEELGYADSFGNLFSQGGPP